MSQPQPQPQAPQPSDRAAALIGFGAGFAVNVAVYQVALWRSRSVSPDWGGMGGMGGIAAALQALCWTTVLVVVAALVARALLIRAGRRLLARWVTIGALLPIVLAPLGTVAVNALVSLLSR